MTKHLLPLLAFCAILNTSCNKDNNNSPSNNNNAGNNGSLNATEQKLIGTWYLKKEHKVSFSGTTIVQDTTISSFSLKPYVVFTTTKHAGANVNGGYNAASKVMTDKAGVSVYGASVPGERGSVS